MSYGWGEEGPREVSHVAPKRLDGYLNRALAEDDEVPKIPDEQVEYLISGLKWKRGTKILN